MLLRGPINVSNVHSFIFSNLFILVTDSADQDLSSGALAVSEVGIHHGLNMGQLLGTMHIHIHTWRQLSLAKFIYWHAFGTWGGTGVPAEKLHRHGGYKQNTTR